jgi:hypothetical protein
MQAICYVVSSGSGASYQVPGGEVVLCSDISPYKNCDGKFPFKDIAFETHSFQAK